MADMGFGSRLVRVIKSVKKRSKNGGTQRVRQAFYVKKANPGDEYAQSTQRNTGSLGEKPTAPTLPPAAQTPDVVQGLPTEQEPEPLELKNRIEVRYYDVPWIIGGARGVTQKNDPIPDQIRARYAKDNRSAQVVNPLPGDVPLDVVAPTDPILWGMNEPETLDKLRTAAITRLKLIGRDNGIMIATLEYMNATSLSAYLSLDSLVDPYLFVVWGDFYDLEKGDGSVSKRSAASYEVAKATGFDDLVPPTAVRFDEYGDIGPVLPDDLLERFHYSIESLSRRTGEPAETIRNRLGGYAALQLRRGEPWTIEHEQWFIDIFSADAGEERKNVLNNLFESMPEDRRMPLVRTAAFDFILWTGDRNFGDILFCQDERHPIQLIGNELSLPCPRKMGLRLLETGGDFFVTTEIDPKAGVPMLWSDPLIMLATRGGERELDDFEKIGIYVANRIKGDRAFELARSLIEHGISPLAVAGVLSRAWLMGTHAREIARDPYLVARYYADLIAERDVTAYEGIELFVNRALHAVLIKDFDFASAIRNQEEDDDAGIE